DAAGEAEQVDGVDSADTDAEGESERVRLEPEPRPDGPWDSTEVREPGEGRVDLGGIFVPGVEGMELRVEVAGDAIVAATVVLQLPDDAQMVAEGAGQDSAEGSRFSGGMGQLARGPEITEVR